MSQSVQRKGLTLRNLLSIALDTFQTIFLPGCSSLSISNVLNIINSGFSVTEKISNEDIREITETAKLLSIDITGLVNDENVPSLDKPSQDTINNGVGKVENERDRFQRKTTFDDSMDIYDESTESVFDALLRIFDSGNDSVESNFNSVENMSSDNHTQTKETVVDVRGTKRKRSDVSNKKDGKYQCPHCDYENSKLACLRAHVESRHEGVRYPCDQCGYKATTERHLKGHKENKHEGVRYPCDKCDYKGSRVG